MNTIGRTVLCLFGGLAASAAAGAGVQNLQLTRSVPDLDRWNYPFNATPGVKDTAANFGALGAGILDEHDAQFLLGFETATPSADGVGVIPAGLGAGRYEIVSARLTTTIVTGGVFTFDGTFDAWTSYLPAEDPEFTADTDDGHRPIMLFGTGYRAGWGVTPGTQEYVEDSPYRSDGGMAPEPRVRNAFASDFAGGSLRDISNNVTDRFEIAPFAVGQISVGGTPLALGDSVPAEATVTFDIDLANPDAVAFLQDALDLGKLRLSLTSLHFASGGPGGGGGVTYPVYFTKEDPLAVLFGQTPTLALEVNILPAVAADLDGDGAVGGSDLAILLAAWGTPTADLDGDGTTGGSDLAVLLAAWG